MPKLSDITEASVNLAVAEYDRLGREEFLRINGFGRAETYFLKRGRRIYDSKAIVGCAYGYEHPMEGHLRSSQFSGGESRVEALLTRLGFKVVPDVSSLLRPKQLCSRDEFLSRPCPVPARKGVYAWYFREPPPGVAVAGCWKHDGYTLLYVGIAPNKRRERSLERLRARIHSHFAGNAEASCLRLALGCLLAAKLGLELRRCGGGHHVSFRLEGEEGYRDGEKELSEWMARNAFVAWMEHCQPWTVEKYLIHDKSPPLNIEGNPTNPFRPELRKLLAEARLHAAGAPVIP